MNQVGLYRNAMREPIIRLAIQGTQVSEENKRNQAFYMLEELTLVGLPVYDTTRMLDLNPEKEDRWSSYIDE